MPSARLVPHALLLLACLSYSCFGRDEAVSGERSPLTESLQSDHTVLNYDDRDVNCTACLDNNGHMWFGTSREGVFHYDGKTFTNYTTSDGLNAMKVNVIMQDSDGIMWFGTPDGLCSYDGNAFSHLPLPNKAEYHAGNTAKVLDDNSNMVLSLLEDRKGNLWIGTCGGGVYTYDGKDFTNYLSEEGRIQPSGSYFNVIQSLVEDNTGNIWITSQTHGGITRYDGVSFTNYTLEHGLPDDMVFSSFVDSKGNVWFGYLDGGMSRYDGKTFTHISEADGLCNNMVSGFCEGRDGRLWVASFRDNGICIFDGADFSTLAADKHKAIREIRFIVEDDNGALWFGGRGGSLWRYDGSVLTDFTHRKYNS